MVVFEKNLSYSVKFVVLGQSGLIRAKGLYSGKVFVIRQNVCIRAKVVVFGQSNCVRAEVI